MRAAIGLIELDAILHARGQLNASVTQSLSAAADSSGLNVLRYELTEISPDRQIQIAMDKQAVAERNRREQVITFSVVLLLPLTAVTCVSTGALRGGG
jgi:regulator of protease activity HflC (stomatin/prohibitin superfamily)